MLQTKNLSKIYKPKKGVPVKALDNVSLNFPDTGMVFLLGKSGSGKSTLLNLLGGLDKYDDGEIIIKGVSSKSFDAHHFDSYRNTYVGFIFQEYNVIDEFSVGANIALAIELQGKKADDKTINEILSEVDLDGYGSRKPNELSGGQKQRVAIARALVKNPEIIMADEPTGALDSTTGRQIFDTLKKLSKSKLVIVVSHDREFAEKYADRIIELADGRVISDMEYTVDDTAESAPLTFSGNKIEISESYRLTEDDRIAINEYLDKIKAGKVEIVASAGGNTSRAAKAVPTDESKIERKNSTAFKLIKSKLPLKNAFKIGSGALKYKKIRLIVTILLSCVAFGLFGLADTFGSYNHINACTDSLIDSDINYASLVKETKMVDGNGNPYYIGYGLKIGDSDIKTIENDTGIKMTGVYSGCARPGMRLGFEPYFDSSATADLEYQIYPTYMSGFAEITEESMRGMNFKLIAGKLPDGSKNEIAISKYVCETFMLAGYSSDGSDNFEKISSPENMIGKTLSLAGREYTISAVIDTGFNFDRYKKLNEKSENETPDKEIIKYALSREMSYDRTYSLHCAAMVGEGHVKGLIASSPDTHTITRANIYFGTSEDDYAAMPESIGKLNASNAKYATMLPGAGSVLSDKEMVVSLNLLRTIYGLDCTTDELVSKVGDVIFNTYNYNDGTSEQTTYKIVGYIDTTEYPELSDTILVSDSVFAKFASSDEGKYDYAVGAMPKSESEVKSLISYCYREDTDVRYSMVNSVTFELDAVNSVLKELSKIFLYIGIGFAVFAALMLSNFIATSITYKKQEIGILRAIGAGSRDVFLIFFAESFIIAMINFVLSSAGVGIATAIINHVLRTDVGVLVTVLRFGIRQIGLIFAISLATAAVASFIPVKKIASKRPIDAIRNR